MKRNHANYALAGALALASAGCSSIHNTLPYSSQKSQRQDPGVYTTTEPSKLYKTENYSAPYNVKGSLLGKFSNDDIKYSLESLLLYKTQVYAVTNMMRGDEQLPFALYTATNTTRVINTDSKRMKLKPESVYVPEMTTNSSGNHAYSLSLSPAGEYAKKATMFKPNAIGIAVGVAKLTQDSAQFDLETQRIMGADYYIIHVEDSKKNDTNALPYYFLPKQLTTIEIKPDGKIRLESLNGIYRPQLKAPSEYFSEDNVNSQPKKGAKVIGVE